MQNPFELVLFQTLSHCSSSLSVKTCITCLVKLQSCSVDKYNTEEQAPLMYDMAAGCADRWMKIHYCTLRYPSRPHPTHPKHASPPLEAHDQEPCQRWAAYEATYKKLASVQSILLMHSLPASMRSSRAVWVNLTGMKVTEIRLKLCNEIAMIGYDVIHKHWQTKAPSHTLEHRSEHVHFTY